MVVLRLEIEETNTEEWVEKLLSIRIMLVKEI